MKRLAWLVVLAACGDNHHPTTVIMDVGAQAPAYGSAPFPTDAVRDGDHLGAIAGLDRIAGGKSELIQAHLAALDGWGLRPAVEFFVDGPVDPATVPAETSTLADPLVVLDVDPASPDQGAVIAMDWQYEPDRGEIVGSPHPGAMLHEATRYAAIVTRDVHAPGGEPLYAGNLDALRSGAPARWQTTADAYAKLSARPELAGRIAGLAVFTTQHASDVLVAARDELADPAQVAPPQLAFGDPALIFDTPARLDALLGQATRDTTGPRAGLEQWGTDNPTGIAHDHVAVVATGTITIARFRRPDRMTFQPDDATFEVGPDGKPVLQAIDPIPVTIVLPTGPVPAGGFPVVIFGHGLGGSRTAMMNLAEPLAEQGYAMIAIDMVGHGSRYDPTDALNNFAFGRPGFTGDPMLRDGFGDHVGQDVELALFDSFENFAAIRDVMRQSALDFTRVATLIQQGPDLSALAGPYGTTPRFDPTRVAYLGESFGTVVGTAVAAIEPSVGLYVLDVPGGGILDYILPNSPEISALALPAVQAIYRTQGTLDRFHPMIAAVQAVFDGSDPLTFAPHVLADRFTIAGAPLPPRHVVAIEAMHDEIMSNQGTSVLATALGLGVLTPDLTAPPGVPEVASPASGNVDGQTGVLVQYWPATHGYNWSAQHGQLKYQLNCPCAGDDRFPLLPAPVTIQEPIYETMAQVAEILQTYFAGQAPVVRSTKPPDPSWTP